MREIKRLIPFAFLCFLLFFSSCRSSKSVLYLQNAAQGEKMVTEAEYSAVITEDDLLSIIVSCEDFEAALPFNTPMAGLGNNFNNTSNRTVYGYLVDKDGNIDFPVLGKIYVKGMTRDQLSELLKEKLQAYLKNPIVTVQFLNFRVTVLGEVKTPGNYAMNSERVTIFEALGRAGDLVINAKRNDILVVRDNGNEKEFGRIDLTSKDIFTSPYYYLKQNDVIYVEPSKGRIFQGDASTYLPLVLSVVTTLIAILAFFK